MKAVGELPHPVDTRYYMPTDIICQEIFAKIYLLLYICEDYHL